MRKASRGTENTAATSCGLRRGIRRDSMSNGTVIVRSASTSSSSEYGRWLRLQWADVEGEGLGAGSRTATHGLTARLVLDKEQGSSVR